MNHQLENKVGLVTGSTAGVGVAIAKSLAAEGARVIVNGRTEPRVAEAISSLRADVSSASQRPASPEGATRRFPRALQW
jgi:3-oxoacyl-[acyl-carrier protein] reductase